MNGRATARVETEPDRLDSERAAVEAEDEFVTQIDAALAELEMLEAEERGSE